MNKFLEFAFKMGKVMSSILLVLVLLVILITGIGLLTSNHESLQTPNFSEINNVLKERISAQSQQSSQNNDDISVQKNKSDKYNLKIKNIVKENNLRSEMEGIIKKYVAEYDESLRAQYVNGLAKFYKDGLRDLNKSDKVMDEYLLVHVKRMEGYYYEFEYNQAKKNIKPNGIYNKYICLGLLHDYDSMFEDALQTRESKLQAKSIEKIAQEATLGIALIVFTILLFLPVLIKIEENTRPVSEETAENTVVKEELKQCIHCGKSIKLNAKKCRYCGKWQNKEGGNE